MKAEPLPPDAPVLLEAMRAIGYDASTAIADLVDNSIAAMATRVSIRFDPGRAHAIAVIDDGTGMTPNELRSAMRHGSRDPKEVRPDHDLGRFGLGLKTASMSQCRRLIVVSRKGGVDSGMVWDLDQVTSDWLVGVLDPDEITSVPFFSELSAFRSGTLVVWEKLDRLAAGDIGDGALLAERMRQAGEHLSLVFHRYISDLLSPVTLDINNRPLEPLDPFLQGAGSVIGQDEHIRVGEHTITLKAFTLPHISRLSRKQIELAGGEIGLRRQQGFYVYRNRRLIVWGTWFRLTKQEELTKLTRVRVDVPNAVDQLWSLDIKKSVAMPPPHVRERLKELVPKFVEPSERANRWRGKVSEHRGIHPLWRRIDMRDGGIRYEPDLEHPLISSLRHAAGELNVRDIDNLLRAIADSLPIEAIYNDRANDVIGHKSSAPPQDELVPYLEDLARQLLSPFPEGSAERTALVAKLCHLEPFAFHADLIPTLQKRLS